MKTLKLILKNLSKNIKFIGNENTEISNPLRLEDVFQKKDSSKNIIFLTERATEKQENLCELKNKEIGLVITTENIFSKINNDKSNYILTDNPREVFNKVIKQLYDIETIKKIEKSAIVSTLSKVGENCYIGHGVVIEDNVEIGDNTKIFHNTVIRANTKIGNYVQIGCNNTIGSRGFGYEKNSENHFESIFHIGGVIIEDFVEIHNNTCIDKAVMGNTIIKKGAKIDNLVHIAHGVEIGENTLVIANSMIGGSSKIGNSSWIAPSVSVINKIEIGQNSLIGMGSVVTKNMPDNFKGFGNPVQDLDFQKKWLKIKSDLSNK